MIAPEKIAWVMGLRKGIRSLSDLSEAVSRGLPKSALRRSVERVVDDPRQRREVMHHVIPAATLKRRKDRLKREESERIERLARVIATAEYVWSDMEAAKLFLNTPHVEIGGRRPLEAAYTELGARQVEELLWKIFHGLPV
jgi:putative toxin-antitoxin system antitoxin component (TIGR02293 family)